MIFKSVDRIASKQEKSFFLELISIYCKTVYACCELNQITLYHNSNKEIGTDVLDELIQMGVMTDSIQIGSLRGILGTDFWSFIDCVQTYLLNKNNFKGYLDKLSNTQRNKLQKRDKEKCNPMVADFFAGAGGLSLGFIQSGYSVCFANDFEEVCINTYLYNHPEIPSSRVILGDIRLIVNNIEDYIKDDVDVVIGGPPCQGFSSANQQRIIDDPRNELYKYFLKAVEKLAPKFVVMENVRGMLSVAEQVVGDYKAIKPTKHGTSYSYEIKYELLNSADFSVCQSRERLIYIAIRNDIALSHNITPQVIFDEIKESCRGNKRFNLQSALDYIKPLDAPRIKNSNEIDDEKTGKKIDVNHFSGKESEYLRLINQGKSIPFVFNHKARFVSDVNYDIYRLLKPGEDASNERIADIMPYKHRLHCFKDKYYKLIPDRPSRTITAHLRMDCHSHIHPFQIRAITPREAARCQSFPDDYLFLGAYLKTYMQIGNAVPVLMSRQIATIIKRYI